MTVYHFAIYEAETGKVLRVGKSTNRRQRVLERRNLKAGEAIYAGEVDPQKQFLPGGVPTERPADVPVITVDQVKAHAARLLSYSDWYVTRKTETGAAIPARVRTYRKAVRAASNRIDAMKPIPADYLDPKHWPVAP